MAVQGADQWSDHVDFNASQSEGCEARKERIKVNIARNALWIACFDGNQGCNVG